MGTIERFLQALLQLPLLFLNTSEGRVDSIESGRKSYLEMHTRREECSISKGRGTRVGVRHNKGSENAMHHHFPRIHERRRVESGEWQGSENGRKEGATRKSADYDTLNGREKANEKRRERKNTLTHPA